MLGIIGSKAVSMDLNFYISVSSFCVAIKRKYCIKYQISATVNCDHLYKEYLRLYGTKSSIEFENECFCLTELLY